MTLVDEYTHDVLNALRGGQTLEDAMRDLTLKHAERLSEPAASVDTVEADRCPRCKGVLLVGDRELRCAAGCGWAGRHGAAA